MARKKAEAFMGITQDGTIWYLDTTDMRVYHTKMGEIKYTDIAAQIDDFGGYRNVALTIVVPKEPGRIAAGYLTKLLNELRIAIHGDVYIERLGRKDWCED